MIENSDFDFKKEKLPSLARKIVHGGMWIFLWRIIEKLLGLIRLIVVARLLSPNDFGLLGVAALVTAILNIFIESGFNQALIQKKETIQKFLNTAWTVQAIRGVFIFAIIWFIAPFAANFFNEPKSLNIIRFFSFTQVIDGFRNIGLVLFQKEMEFKKQFFCNIFPEIIALIATIWAAYILHNVWALVIGAIVCSVFIFIFSYAMHPYRPRLEFNLSKFKILISFGKWVIGYGILGFLIIQGDDILVGKVLGAAALGLYQMAYRISNLPATQITHVIIQVTFPAYAKMQDNIPRLREAYLRVLKIVGFISFPLAGLIFLFSSDFTEIFLGTKWMQMVPAMQVLCVFGLIRSLTSTTGPIFVGVGKPKIMTWLSSIQLIVMIIIIYPLTKRWGILGTAIATLIPNLITPVLASMQLLKIIKCSLRNFLVPIIVPMICSGVMINFGLFLLKINGQLNIFLFLINVIAAIGCYLMSIYFIGRMFNYNISEFVAQIVQQFRSKDVV
ncbi:MAG: lipopolysaccharide biosynthesis protein [Candidatus Omnitrophica bacterium]|nr:lipopolysaccharide biosynthesis protein [Candidatus Omnitrophota bacterium]